MHKSCCLNNVKSRGMLVLLFTNLSTSFWGVLMSFSRCSKRYKINLTNRNLGISFANSLFRRGLDVQIKKISLIFAIGSSINNSTHSCCSNCWRNFTGYSHSILKSWLVIRPNLVGGSLQYLVKSICRLVYSAGLNLVSLNFLIFDVYEF